jgi:pimeloyl-ACP methyl ester carboxylesterase
MFDHARSFARLAPILAQRFRVLSLDARGHGDSSWADGYTWPLDVLDIINVLGWIDRPTHLIGHSKGGGQVIDAATSTPQRVRKVVNIDGFGPPPLDDARLPKPERFTEFLDARRGADERQTWKPYPTLDHLVQRRGQQNPRLQGEWLRFFVFHAARQHDDGWVWKSDPYLAQNFGPWKPEWIAFGYKAMRAPVLAIVGSELDTWGPLPESILAPRLECLAEVERSTISGTGHFVHMEKPEETARVILDYLDS